MFSCRVSIRVPGTFAFELELGMACTVVSVLSDRGNLFNSFEERAHIEFEWQCEQITNRNER